MKKLVALALSLTLALSLVACGKEAPKEDIAIPYKIGVLAIDDSLPIHIADKDGYFKESGLNVEVIPFKSSHEEAQAFESGELDMIMNDMIVQQTMKKSGTDAKVVATAFGANPEAGRFVVLAKPGSEIKTAEDFYGKKIAISTNTMMEYLVNSYFTHLNLDPNKVTFVNIPNLGTRLETLIAGKDIDGAILPDPLASLAMLQGASAIIDDTTLEENFSQSVLLVKEATTKERKEATQLVLDNIFKAMDELNAKPTNYMEVEREFARIPKPLTKDYPMPKYTTKHLPTEKEVESVQNWLLEKGTITEKLDYNALVDTQFIGA